MAAVCEECKKTVLTFLHSQLETIFKKSKQAIEEDGRWLFWRDGSPIFSHFPFCCWINIPFDKKRFVYDFLFGTKKRKVIKYMQAFRLMEKMESLWKQVIGWWLDKFLPSWCLVRLGSSSRIVARLSSSSSSDIFFKVFASIITTTTTIIHGPGPNHQLTFSQSTTLTLPDDDFFFYTKKEETIFTSRSY